jgi:transporter family protein
MTSESGGKMESNSRTWWIYALLSAVFAALTTIFAKIGVENVNSNLATFGHAGGKITAIVVITLRMMAFTLVFAINSNNFFSIPQCKNLKILLPLHPCSFNEKSLTGHDITTVSVT